MVNLTGNEVLTELSLNGVGVGSSDVPRVNRALLEGRAQSHCWTALASKRDDGLKNLGKKSCRRGRKTIRVIIHCARMSIYKCNWVAQGKVEKNRPH